eukprot:SAG11_NODE_3798_length_2218_cov_1.281265_3_plen_106_part_00
MQDPKAYEWPLVGVWVSDVESVCDALVWLSCVGFGFNKALSERVGQNGSFLLLLYGRDDRKSRMFEWRLSPDAAVDATTSVELAQFSVDKRITTPEVFDGGAARR